MLSAIIKYMVAGLLAIAASFVVLTLVMLCTEVQYKIAAREQYMQNCIAAQYDRTTCEVQYRNLQEVLDE